MRLVTCAVVEAEFVLAARVALLGALAEPERRPLLPAPASHAKSLGTAKCNRAKSLGRAKSIYAKSLRRAMSIHAEVTSDGSMRVAGDMTGIEAERRPVLAPEPKQTGNRSFPPKKINKLCPLGARGTQLPTPEPWRGADHHP